MDSNLNAESPVVSNFIIQCSGCFIPVQLRRDDSRLSQVADQAIP